ncbi:MAG: AI-2E family transporter [Schwartzia sp.]|jgi:predicted PurR-regulated permease PerM|nr:AI-2E family transporter [Schwartzia sp. (in: firmicutes)]
MWATHKTSILLGISFILLLGSFWLLPQLAFVVFIALLLHLLLCPMVDYLHRYRMIPRGLAAAITLILFLIAVTVLFTVLSTPLARSAQKFSQDLPALTESMRDLFASYPAIAQEVDKFWRELASFGIDALRSSLDVLFSFFSKIFDVVIILFSAFYLLKDGREIEEWITRLFPKKDHLRVFKLFDRILLSLHTYICSQIAICLLMGTVVFLYFTARDIPYAVVFAVLSGVSEFIPVIGPTIAALFGVSVAATISLWMAAQTLFFYLLITQANHNIIYPTLIGKSLHLHPIAILLGLLLGGCLLDAPGMFLAVPLMVIIRLVIEDIYRDAEDAEQPPPPIE